MEKLIAGDSGDVGYILNAQLMEADLIVLNKIDLITAEKVAELLSWLEESYPQARTIAISALSGEGLEEFSRALMDGSASMRLPDIGYGGADFGKAMGKISEFYMQYHATVCCDDFDGIAYLTDMAKAVADGMGAGRDVPHLKLLAWNSEGDYGKADLIGIDRPLQLTKAFERPCTELSVMLNASAVCPGEELDAAICAAVDSISEKYGLELLLFKKECFAMGG